MTDSEKPDETGNGGAPAGAPNGNEPERIPFPGMEVGTDLSIALPGGSGRIKGSLIGMAPDQFLIIRLPAAPGISNRCLPGSEVIVRYLFKGSVIGFTSSVIQLFCSPVMVCFLKFPNFAERVNLRREKRIQCFFPGMAQYLRFELQGAMLDLSPSGCRFFIEESPLSRQAEIRKTDKISLHIDTFGVLEGQIANVANLPGILSLGIAFTRIAPECEQRVAEMLEMASKFLPFQI